MDDDAVHGDTHGADARRRGFVSGAEVAVRPPDGSAVDRERYLAEVGAAVRRRAGAIDLAAELLAAGRSVVELQDGTVVVHRPDGTSEPWTAS